MEEGLWSLIISPTSHMTIYTTQSINKIKTGESMVSICCNKDKINKQIYSFSLYSIFTNHKALSISQDTI